MPSKLKQRRNSLIAELKRFGFTDYYFQNRTKHDAIIINYKGQKITHIFCSSSKDHRSLKNNVMDLRRTLRNLSQ